MRDDDEGFGPGRESQPARLRVARRVDALPSLFEFCGKFCSANGAGDASRSTADFVLEEMFTNMVKYNPTGEGDIEIELRRQGEVIAVSITDFDSDRFDPREAGEVDVGAPLIDRKPGGLGIHLVKRFAKRVDYDYIDRRSRVTIYLDLG